MICIFPDKISVLPHPKQWVGTKISEKLGRIISEFSYINGYLWAGKLGWKSENPQFSVGGPNPLGQYVDQNIFLS